MKTNSIKAKHVYSEKKQNTVYLKQNNKTWFPINFQWIPVVKLNNELNLKTNKMKNLIILPILALLVFTTSCSNNDDTVFGSGNLISETRTVDQFTKIKSEGIFEVTVTQGASQSIEITADNNIIDLVKTSVNSNELKLYLDEDYNYNGITIQANITVTSLNSLRNFGAGDMYVHNIDNISVFIIENEGSGNIEIDGVSNSLTIQNQGSGDILSFDFIVNNCEIVIEGSGDVEITCSNNLDVNIEGSGNVYYKGTPSINTAISGSGSVLNAN